MKTIFTFLLLTTGFLLSAQVQHGKITYLRTSEVVLKNHTDEETAQDKEIKAMVAKMSAAGAFDKTYQATFGPTAFNCVEQPKEAAEMTTETAGGGTVTIMTGGKRNPAHFYTNLKEGTILNTDYIFDKGFLVNGKADQLEWILTDKKVAPSELTASLDLLLATAITPTGDTITAGYAPSLPVQVGPINYHGLPGAIITLEIPNGGEKTVFRATNIEISQTPLEISQPTEGKAIDQEKFRSQREKKTKAVRRPTFRG